MILVTRVWPGWDPRQIVELGSRSVTHERSDSVPGRASPADGVRTAPGDSAAAWAEELHGEPHGAARFDFVFDVGRDRLWRIGVDNDVDHGFSLRPEADLALFDS